MARIVYLLCLVIGSEAIDTLNCQLYEVDRDDLFKTYLFSSLAHLVKIEPCAIQVILDPKCNIVTWREASGVIRPVGLIPWTEG